MPVVNHSKRTQSDPPHDTVKQRRPYMAAVSPWFFTHYGKEPPFGWNKWVEEFLLTLAHYKLTL